MADIAWAALMDDDGTYSLGLATRDEPGYAPLKEPLGLATYAEATAEADARNERLGLTREEATKIIASSMAAQHAARPRKRQP